MTSITPICRGDGKIVGYVSGKYFNKRVSASKHFLRKKPAIAFDLTMLWDVESKGATEVRVTDRESGKTYCAPLGLIWEKGRELDYGHGRQWKLPLRFWHIKGEAVQLKLFVGDAD